MRKKWIDSLRGIAVLLVVFGHCVPSWNSFFLLTSPVKMPLFFAISGYLFNPRSGNLKAFIVNIFFKLFIPWIILGMVYPYTDPWNRFISLMLGAEWFMPTLIISETIWFFIRKYSFSAAQSCLCGLLVSSFGLLLNNYTDFSYTIIYNALIVQSYIVLGYLFYLKEDCLFRNRKYILLFSFFVYVLLIIASFYFYPGKSLDVHFNRYYSIPICFLLIFSGCIFMFLLFKKTCISPRWLVFVGQNTFVIYMLHFYTINILPKLCKLFGFNLNVPFQIEALLRAISGCVICCIIALFINRFCPFVVGKKKAFSDRA